jgi:hypothetical protein
VPTERTAAAGNTTGGRSDDGLWNAVMNVTGVCLFVDVKDAEFSAVRRHGER